MSMMIALKSANPDQPDTLYYINPEHVVSFYKSVANGVNKTVIYMSDNKTYDVVESPQAIAVAMKKWLDNWL